MNIDTDLKRKLRAEELKVQEEIEQQEREEARKNRNFVQFYRNHMPEFSCLIELNPLAARIFFFFMEHMDNLNALVCSYAVLEDALGVSRATVARALKTLKDYGFIDTLKLGNASVYVLNQKVVWSSWDNQKKYCKFDGKIIISQRENKDYNINLQVEKIKTIRNTEHFKRQMEAARKYGLQEGNNDNN